MEETGGKAGEIEPGKRADVPSPDPFPMQRRINRTLRGLQDVWRRSTDPDWGIRNGITDIERHLAETDPGGRWESVEAGCVENDWREDEEPR